MPPELASPLAELLSFRHFFRHAYGVVLDPKRIIPLLGTLGLVVGPVGAALDRFDAFLASTAARP